MAELGGDAVALLLQAEGVAIRVVNAAVLAGEGRHHVHLPGLVAQRDPPAGVWIASGCDGDRRQASGDLGPLGIAQVGALGVGADRADPHRPLGRPGAQVLDGRVQGVSQVGQGVGVGEQIDRGSVAIPFHQAEVALVAALARPVQVGEQTGGVAGALKADDHGTDLEGERRNGARGRASGRRGSADSAIWPCRRSVIDSRAVVIPTG